MTKITIEKRPVARSEYWRERLAEQERGYTRIAPSAKQVQAFDNAVVTISAFNLAEKINNGPFKTGKLGGCNATMTELWNAALVS